MNEKTSKAVIKRWDFVRILYNNKIGVVYSICKYRGKNLYGVVWFYDQKGNHGDGDFYKKVLQKIKRKRYKKVNLILTFDYKTIVCSFAKVRTMVSIITYNQEDFEEIRTYAKKHSIKTLTTTDEGCTLIHNRAFNKNFIVRHYDRTNENK